MGCEMKGKAAWVSSLGSDLHLDMNIQPKSFELVPASSSLLPSLSLLIFTPFSLIPSPFFRSVRGGVAPYA